MVKLLFILLLTSIPMLPLYSQEADSLKSKILTTEQMREDLSLYRQLLTETHPGLYRYQTKAEFNEAYRLIETEIDQALPFYRFYNLLGQFSAQIRCAHTQVFPVEDIMVSLKNSFKVFPLFLYPIDSRLYVLFTGIEGESIMPGDELISINGRSIKEIREIIENYFVRDGNNNEVLRKYLQGGMFSLYYYLYVERPTNFDLVLKDLEGQEKAVKVPAMNYSYVEKNYVNNPLNKEMMAFYNKKQKNWDMEILEEVPSTAYISISSFGSNGIHDEDEARDAFRKFMDRNMKKIHKSNIENLIIELRGNRGGWDIQGQELFSYLAKSDSEVRYYAGQSTITIDSEFLKYADFSAEELESSKEYLTLMEDGTYKMEPAGNVTLLPVKPKQNRFRGNVYILMDEGCASTCAEFTAIAKANKSAVLVGNETGGAMEGGNGGSFIAFTLPNSGIHVNTPLVKYQMAVPEVELKGRGIIPDYTVMPDLNDVLNGRDATKEFVFKLIRNQ